MARFPIAGVGFGHVTRADTGVTVLLFPAGSVGAAEVRGGAPATREFDVLHPSRTVARVDAVTFAGSSAFGLAAADGVMRYLVERGQGFPTAGGPVPIVPTACIFDLAESGAGEPVTAADGEAAATDAARPGDAVTGRVGAGSGATVGKWRGREDAVPGGLGIAAMRGRRRDDCRARGRQRGGRCRGLRWVGGCRFPRAGRRGRVPNTGAVRRGRRPLAHDTRRRRHRCQARQAVVRAGRRECARRLSRVRCSPRTPASTATLRWRSQPAQSTRTSIGCGTGRPW